MIKACGCKAVWRQRALLALSWMLMSAAAGCAAEMAQSRPEQAKNSGPDRSSVEHVGSPEVVLSAKERPYSWPDGTMGIVRDGERYRFFAASVGYPIRTEGTLQNPIAHGIRELKIGEMKGVYDYVAGGPVYRDRKTGTLLMFYHAEVYIFPGAHLPFYSEIGLARSTDDGGTWKDLGIILTPNQTQGASFFRIERRSWDIGWGAFAIVGEYFYLYFSDLLDAEGRSQGVHHAVARARIADVLDAAIHEGRAATWMKFHQGSWSEPGIRGKSSALLTHGEDSFILGDVSYNTHLRKYVAVLIGEPWPNSDLYWIESEDGLRWTHYQKIGDDPGHELYVTLAGLEEDPRMSGKEFYLYYIHSLDFARTGDRNGDGKLVRRRISVR